MSRISAFPQGLLDALGSQNFGENVSELSRVLVPVVDILGQYLVSKQVLHQIPLFNPANGTNSAARVDVPAGELWRVHWFSVFGQCDVGESFDFAPMFVQDGTGMALSRLVSVGASNTAFNPMEVQPFWAPAGTSFRVWAQNVTLAPSASAGLLVSKLRA